MIKRGLIKAAFCRYTFLCKSYTLKLQQGINNAASSHRQFPFLTFVLYYIKISIATFILHCHCIFTTNAKINVQIVLASEFKIVNDQSFTEFFDTHLNLLIYNMYHVSFDDL